MRSETELVTKYAEIKAKLDKLNEEKDEIRREIAEILHHENVNSKVMVDEYGTEWEPKYQKSSRKQVNYSLLLEEVGREKYDEIVNETTSTSLVIRKAPKKKKTKEEDITKSSPKEEEQDITKNIPKGSIE